MEDKISDAVKFIGMLIKKGKTLPEQRVEQFCECLSAVLLRYYAGHWYPDAPRRGQAYRCLRHNSAKGLEPLLAVAAHRALIQPRELCLPAELTVWVDPDNVCYRFGESTGSYCHVTLEDFADNDYGSGAFGNLGVSLTAVTKSTPGTPTKPAMLSHPNTPTTKCTPAQLANSGGGGGNTNCLNSPVDIRRTRSCNSTPVRRHNGRRGSATSTSTSAAGVGQHPSAIPQPHHGIEPLSSIFTGHSNHQHQRDRTSMPPPAARNWYERSHRGNALPDKMSSRFTNNSTSMRHPDLIRA